ncbi:hypothetical protein N0V82_009528 [Gnomoniopsis sp. IMI 355080]|nr:hypothetical protein N0V82_009528 [Gnomoniopsis sp. IMI 355080]
MPLAGINDLFELAAKKQASKSVLLSSATTKTSPMVWVNEEFFKLKPQGNSGVSKNALGFLSVLMTYVKGVDHINSIVKSDNSPKMLTSIMPRTYFTTMFDLVKSDLKFTSTTTGLYYLIRVLSCYEVYWDDAVDIIVDTAYCKDMGTKAPEPIAGKLDNAAFEFPASGSMAKRSIKLKDWISGIQTSKKTEADMLSTADKDFFDGQIGGLKDGTEYVLGTKTEAPLFEFRDLAGIKANQIEAKAVALEKAIVALHQTYGKTS